MTDCAESSEELAILLQETVEELKQQRELNKELKALIEQNTRQLTEIAEKQTDERPNGRSSCGSTPRVNVSLQKPAFLFNACWNFRFVFTCGL